MAKELVAIYAYGRWNFIHDITVTEVRVITDPQECIDLIKENYPEFINGVFTVEGSEIYCTIDADFCINNTCPINGNIGE